MKKINDDLYKLLDINLERTSRMNKSIKGSLHLQLKRQKNLSEIKLSHLKAHLAR